MQEDIDVLEFSHHLVSVGDEVGRQVAAIELHAFDNFELALGSLGFFDGDDAFVADLLHRFGNHVANRRFTVGGNRSDLANLLR